MEGELYSILVLDEGLDLHKSDITQTDIADIGSESDITLFTQKKRDKFWMILK